MRVFIRRTIPQELLAAAAATTSAAAAAAAGDLQLQSQLQGKTSDPFPA